MTSLLQEIERTLLFSDVPDGTLKPRKAPKLPKGAQLEKTSPNDLASYLSSTFFFDDLVSLAGQTTVAAEGSKHQEKEEEEKKEEEVPQPPPPSPKQEAKEEKAVPPPATESQKKKPKEEDKKKEEVEETKQEADDDGNDESTAFYAKIEELKGAVGDLEKQEEVMKLLNVRQNILQSKVEKISTEKAKLLAQYEDLAKELITVLNLDKGKALFKDIVTHE